MRKVTNCMKVDSIPFKSLITLFLLFYSGFCTAKQVSAEQSLIIAKRFYSEQRNSQAFKVKSTTNPEFKLDYISTDANMTLDDRALTKYLADSTIYFYVYNIGNKEGFIIVSGDNRTKPILGYSDEGEFISYNMPKYIQKFLNNYKVQIKTIMQNNGSVSDFNQINDSVMSSKNAVEPLIKTKWGQDNPYNSKIPDNYVTGCIATSMAQIMNFHKWPKQGYFSRTYMNGKYSANFCEAKYDWDNMLNEYDENADTSTLSSKAVAILMYHCGVSVGMKYGNISTASDGSVPDALKNYFGYDRNVTYISHYNKTDSYWKNTIISELDAGRPVILGGYNSGIEGHSYIGDGYDQNKLIHINWGWDGFNDGYFEISSLASTPDNISFFWDQSAIIGMKKPVENFENTLLYSLSINIPTNSLTSKFYNIPIPITSDLKITLQSSTTIGKSFNGKVGISLYQNNNQYLIFDSTTVAIKENTCVREYAYTSFTSKIRGEIPSGTYQVRPVFKTQSDLNWIPLYDYENQNIEVEISDSVMMFFQNSKTIKSNKPGDIVSNSSNKERLSLNRLIVSGPIGNQDMQIMSYDYMTNARIIDLKEADIVDNKQELLPFAFSRSLIKSIELPWNLKGIGNSAFSGCSNLENISIPKSVTTIRDSLFYSCNNLKSVTFPDSLISIGNSAFNGCRNLLKIDFPSNIDSIYNQAFKDCDGLVGIYLYNVKPPFVADDAFQNISMKIPLHVPFGSKSIYASTPVWKNFTNIIDDLPAKVNKNIYNPIAGKLSTNFKGNEGEIVTNLTITGNLNYSDISFIRDSLHKVMFLDISEVKLSNNTIQEKAFYRNQLNYITLLEKIILPKYLEAIGDSAFKNCTNLNDISFPKYLSKIGKGAFVGCQNLTEFKKDYENSYFSIFDGVLCNSDLSVLILYPVGKTDKKFTVRYIKKLIGNSAFSESLNLEEVVLPQDISIIEDFAFNGCKNLKMITFPASIKYIGNKAFNSCTSIVRLYSESTTPPLLGTQVFEGISKDIEINVPAEALQKYKEDTGWKEFKNYNVQIVKRIQNNIAGKLSTQFTADEKSSVNKLIISGKLNDSDLTFIASSLSKLTDLDIYETDVTILFNGCFSRCNILTNIILPSVLKSINLNAFSNCSGLKSITLPSTLTTIGNNAFSNCISLESIDIPATTSSIGTSVFSGCKKLTAFKIPGSLKEISNNIFNGCSGLTSINIPASITSIGAYSFKNCSAIASITLPLNLIAIGENAFSNCSALKSISIPSSTTSIGKGAFYSCSGLTSMSIPSGITKIEDYTFSYCSSLKSIDIPTTVNSIGIETFKECTNLSSITLPTTITSINERTFFRCTNLTSIKIPSSVISIGNGAFCLCENLTSFTIPSSVKTIGDEAFYYCKSLTSLTIPESITSIGNNVFSNAGLECLTVMNPTPLVLSSTSVFNNLDKNRCILNVPVGSKLAYQNASQWKDFKFITEGDDISTSKVINVTAGNLISALTTTDFYTIKKLTVIGKIDARDFVILRDSMFQLSELDLSNVEVIAYTGTNGTEFSKLTTYEANAIPSNAFNNSRITSVELPNSCHTLSDYAFINCPKLSSVTIPSSVLTIGKMAFVSCFALKSINIPSSVTFISKDAFENCKLLINVNEANSNYSSSEGVLFNKDMSELILFPLSIENYTISSSVKTIKENAFANCHLTSIIIPPSVNRIEDGAFANCYSLTSISIPNSVVYIGNYAFGGCNTITSINIPNSITSISGSTYNGCTSLTSITIPSTVTKIGSSAFNNCRSLTSITIPSSVTEIGESAFYGCSKLTSFYVFNSTPVDLTSTSHVFEGFSQNCFLYVPSGSKSSYQMSNQWKDFMYIIELNTNSPQINSLNLCIYPNPFNDFLNINGFENFANVRIYNLHGKEMINCSISVNETIPVSSLPKGLYVVRVKSNEGEFSTKLLKE